MNLEEVIRGPAFTIAALVNDNGACPLLDFLNELREQGSGEFGRIMGLFHFVAVGGMPRNEGKVRMLEGHDGLYEFKTRGGVRVVFFYDSSMRRLVVCTHGFMKKSQKTPRQELERAETLRAMYLAQKGARR